MVNKYRVHEVAKDFGLQSKEVAAILTEFLEPPKNHMQALTDAELNLVFDVLTQRNQISGLEVVFSKTYHEPEAQASPSILSDGAPLAGTPEPTSGDTISEGPTSPVTPSIERVALSPPEVTPKQQQAKRDRTPAPKPERKTLVVDTRGTGISEQSRYDERIENLAADRAGRVGGAGKQKIKKAPERRGSSVVSSKRRAEEQERMRRLQAEATKKAPLKILIPDEISVTELAARLKKTGTDVVKRLVRMGVMVSLGQSVDYDTAALLAMEFGARVEREVVVSIEERLFDDIVDSDENLVVRDPVVVVMGHVDHGKTSLLDKIRQSNVVAGEFGGITQHIGAYRVHTEARNITFLDTPGHAAFTSMRARGAMVTDIAILVVAADDGIMPQTVEAISHAKAAGIPIIVAVNKMDKPAANPDRIMQQLTEYELVAEEWGGDTIVCKVSAHTGEGISHLLEMLLLTADIRELRANPSRPAMGSVIESRLDKGRGPVATLLVQNGTLKQGDIVIAGTAVGRVRAMNDENGRKLDSAGPSVPVEVVGLADVAGAGDPFRSVADERMARELVEQRRQREREERGGGNPQKISLDDLFAQVQDGQMKDLNLIVKADTHGSVEALCAALAKLANPETRVRIIHSSVGAINESDVLLAATTSSIVIGFHVRPDSAAREASERAGIDLRLYRVIYDCIEEIEAAMRGMLAPKYRESVLGRAEVRQTFKASGIGTIAGCYVLDGLVRRNAQVRVLRDNIVVYEGGLTSLKRFKDDAREVMVGYECGINIERFNDLKIGDTIEAFVMEEVKPA